MTGSPSFLELGAPSGSRALAFFQGLFGWTSQPMERDSFACDTPTIGVGIHAGDDDRLIVVYFAVPDIEAAARRVRELGGEAPEPGPEQGRFGRFVECRDDQGVRFGLRQLPRA